MDSYDFIVVGIEKFREQWNLLWNDMVLVTAGDVLSSLASHKVLYADTRPDYAVFEAVSAGEAARVAEKFASLGVKTCFDRQFAGKVWVYVFAHKTTASAGPWPQLPENTNWESPLTNRCRLNSAALPGEMTPFMFRNEEYRLENVMKHYLDENPDPDMPHSDHFRIRRVSDDKLISIPLVNHYFATALVWNDICYCFSLDLGECSGWASSRVVMIKSADLVNWSDPVCVWDVSGDGEKIFNNSITFDGRRFIMLYETDDQHYPVYTLKFAESDDLEHWRKLPDAVYGCEKYTGGPSLYWIAEDQYYYLTYVDMFVHPVVRKLSYRTGISRSKDLIHWQDAPDGRAVLVPDYSNRPDPEGHPEVYELNTSDAEYIERDGVVHAYFCGGNQCGVSDNQTAEYRGTLAEFFKAFYV